MKQEPWDHWVVTCGEPTVWTGFDWPEPVRTYIVLPQAQPWWDSEGVPWPPKEMADLLDALARSADRYENSHSETAHLARYGAQTIRHLLAMADEWENRWKAERRDHEATIEHCDKMLNEGP